jgi:hypothetical protein
MNNPIARDTQPLTPSPSPLSTGERGERAHEIHHGEGGFGGGLAGAPGVAGGGSCVV